MLCEAESIANPEPNPRSVVDAVVSAPVTGSTVNRTEGQQNDFANNVPVEASNASCDTPVASAGLVVTSPVDSSTAITLTTGCNWPRMKLSLVMDIASFAGSSVMLGSARP